MPEGLFPSRQKLFPKIYAYSDRDPELEGLLKIGYTTREVITRVAEQYPTLTPGAPPYKIEIEEDAMRSDGTIFNDRDIHEILKKNNFINPKGEWFRCTPDEVKSAIDAVRNRQQQLSVAISSFKMRPEQTLAVQKTAAFFRNWPRSGGISVPRFLWNAKMRFGKTFTAYQLAREMKWTRVLVLTFKPAVQHAWETDLTVHKDFQDWQFITNDSSDVQNHIKRKKIVCFGSFQDFLGKNSAGGIKVKNEWVHEINWDCVILDEYHYGAWRERAKELVEAEDTQEIREANGLGIDLYDEQILPITGDHYLYLSGTPFRALADGEFSEEQVFNWTYTDEQDSKSSWKGDQNPYMSMPRMVLLTYQLPEALRSVASKGEFDEFDLNVFFSAEGRMDEAKFTFESEVQKWLDLIRGSYLETELDSLRLGSQKPALPFSDIRLLAALDHTFWYLPSISSCHAMKNLLLARQNKFFHGYKIIVAAGSEAGIGVKALKPVFDGMDPPNNTKTITLSCGKLTTGVTIKPWTGIFMLRNLSTPEGYFQAAFRVQSPWTIQNIDGRNPNEETILKKECYVFDFAPNRALGQIVEYSCRLSVDESNPEKQVDEFIKFLPVLAYDGSTMKEIDAAGVLDIALSGTSATLLARRWESALLVNVDNDTLGRLLANEKAMEALMRIEGFRSLSQDLRTIINKSEAINELKKEANERIISGEEKKELRADEKEYKTKRKMIQEKLIKFATRIPVFMYLTDYREYSLKDVIKKLEPELFKKVTGLEIEDFDLLLSLNLFNSALMNDAIYRFKRYEDSSLNYLNYTKHDQSELGLFDTVVVPNAGQTVN